MVYDCDSGRSHDDSVVNRMTLSYGKTNFSLKYYLKSIALKK